MTEEVSGEVGGAFEEGKEPMKGEIPEFRRTRGKDRFIDTHEPIVVPSKEREISESGFCVADNAPHLNRSGLRGEGRLAEIVKNRTTERTKNGESRHHAGDASSLMRSAERY